MYQQSLINTLQPSEWKVLKDETTEIIHFNDGEVIFAAGEPENAVFFIRRGRVLMGHFARISCRITSGISDKVANDELAGAVWWGKVVLEKGAMAGEPNVEWHPRHSFSARSWGGCDLFRLNAEKVAGLKEAYPHLYSRLNEVMQENMEQLARLLFRRPRMKTCSYHPLFCTTKAQNRHTPQRFI